MITIDPFIFLVLVELPVVLAGLVIYFLFQGKKYRTLYRSGIGDLEKAHKAHAELKDQISAIKNGAAQQAVGTPDAAAVPPGADATDLETCKKEVSALTLQLQEKSKLLEDLQKKLEGVEKEYLILYQKHAEKSGD